jgi:hypothetical protein
MEPDSPWSTLRWWSNGSLKCHHPAELKAGCREYYSCRIVACPPPPQTGVNLWQKSPNQEAFRNDLQADECDTRAVLVLHLCLHGVPEVLGAARREDGAPLLAYMDSKFAFSSNDRSPCCTTCSRNGCCTVVGPAVSVSERPRRSRQARSRLGHRTDPGTSEAREKYWCSCAATEEAHRRRLGGGPRR